MVTTGGGRPLTAVLSRRQFIRLSALAAGGLLTGCAVNPVTGRSQLMLVSEDQEIQLDRQNSPYQFSSDYGAVQDAALNRYINQTGLKLASHTHRPQMPYSFRCVNATYVNAYAFPGGSIAATRGILLKLQNEAELAALLGHELGHVNARHTAEQMSKGMLTQSLVGGLAIVAGTQSSALGELTSQLGMLGAGALLASYSRDNERQADALGMEYLARAGYGSEGFVGLMNMLNTLSKGHASATALLFSTHPMSTERYQTALAMAGGQYRYAGGQPLYRERYMDHTAGLRAIRGAIEAMQNGEKEMGAQNYSAAETQFRSALRAAPGDYAGLVLMAKCQLVQEKYVEGARYAESAQQVYPAEAQAHYLGGYARLASKDYEGAYKAFTRYEGLLPGNPNVSFFKGYALEGMQRRKEAAENYYRYLQVVRQGEKAQHAHRRLVEWGYIKN
jgi:predicted Zn-dependent protease